MMSASDSHSTSLLFLIKCDAIRRELLENSNFFVYDKHMEKLEYKDFIEGINNPKGIKQIDFYVDGYPHYHSCSIGRYIEKIKFKGKTAVVDYRITCILTKDHSEDVHFFSTFKEDFKLFNFGKKGRFALKDIWEKIVITNIERFECI